MVWNIVAAFLADTRPRPTRAMVRGQRRHQVAIASPDFMWPALTVSGEPALFILLVLAVIDPSAV